jgi:hypothetical protein
MADRFSAWWHGSPVLQPSRSLNFSAWWHGAPVLQGAGSILQLACAGSVAWAATLEADRTLDPEWRGTPQARLHLALESSGIWQQLAAALPVEALAGLSARKALPAELRATLVQLDALVADLVAALRAVTTLPIAASGDLEQAEDVRFEISSIVAYLYGKHDLPIEVPGVAWSPGAAAAEWRASLERVAALPAELLLAVEQRAAAGAEWRGGIAVRVTAPFEHRAAILLAAREALPYEVYATMPVRVRVALPVEAEGEDPFAFWLYWDVDVPLVAAFDLEWTDFRTAYAAVFPLEWNVNPPLRVFDLLWYLVPQELPDVLADSALAPTAKVTKTP